MKFLFCILLNVMFITHLNKQEVEEGIKQIREWYTEVEQNIKTSKEVVIEDFYSDEYAAPYIALKVWKKDNKVIKAELYSTADWHEETLNFYFQNEKLFFVFIHGYEPEEMYTANELGVSEEELWQMGGKAKTVKHYEERVYLKGEEAIKYLTKKNVVPEDGKVNLSELPNKETNIEEVTYPSLVRLGKEICLAAEE